METSIFLIASVTTGLTLASMSRRTHWLIRVGDFPRLQIIKVLIASILFLGFFKEPVGYLDRLFTLSLVICLVHQIRWVIPHTFLFPKESPDAEECSARQLGVLVFNILRKNRRSSDVRDCIASADADVVLILEPDEWWHNELHELLESYRHVIAVPMDNCFGMILCSKLELIDPRINFLVQNDIPSIRTRIRLRDGSVIDFHGVHPRPPSPVDEGRSTERDAEMQLIAETVRDGALPSIVAGDLNDVPWSRSAEKFRQTGVLLDPRIGRGFYNSFHSRNPLCRFPIDHVLHTKHFGVVELARVKKTCGSDHFPIFVKLAMRRGESAAQSTPGRELAVSLV